MKKQRDPYVIYNLRETYAETGRFEFKVVLNPDIFKNGQESDVTLIDGDMKKVPVEVKRWGRKINCTFVINETVPDGVMTIWLKLCDEGGQPVTGKASCWIIK